jgi:hypothetical protein
MRSNPTNDLLIAVALARFSVEFDDSHPALAALGWQIAEDYSRRWGLRPVDAVALL